MRHWRRLACQNGHRCCTLVVVQTMAYGSDPLVQNALAHKSQPELRLPVIKIFFGVFRPRFHPFGSVELALEMTQAEKV